MLSWIARCSHECWELTDEQWAVVEPGLRPQRRADNGGRPRRDTRTVLDGVLRGACPIEAMRSLDPLLPPHLLNLHPSRFMRSLPPGFPHSPAIPLLTLKLEELLNLFNDIRVLRTVAHRKERTSMLVSERYSICRKKRESWVLEYGDFREGNIGNHNIGYKCRTRSLRVE